MKKNAVMSYIENRDQALLFPLDEMSQPKSDNSSVFVVRMEIGLAGYTICLKWTFDGSVSLTSTLGDGVYSSWIGTDCSISTDEFIKEASRAEYKTNSKNSQDTPKKGTTKIFVQTQFGDHTIKRPTWLLENSLSRYSELYIKGMELIGQLKLVGSKLNRISDPPQVRSALIQRQLRECRECLRYEEWTKLHSESATGIKLLSSKKHRNEADNLNLGLFVSYYAVIYYYSGNIRKALELKRIAERFCESSEHKGDLEQQISFIFEQAKSHQNSNEQVVVLNRIKGEDIVLWFTSPHFDRTSLEHKDKFQLRSLCLEICNFIVLIDEATDTYLENIHAFSESFLDDSDFFDFLSAMARTCITYELDFIDIYLKRYLYDAKRILRYKKETGNT